MPPAAPSRRPTTVAMVPSCAGGIGHISRCAALAGTLQRLDPTIRVEFVLDTERLRPFNIEATTRMGFQPRLLAPRTRESRDDIVQACFGEADVIVDDVARYLLPLRSLVRHAAWISILMHPVGDELFMDWPLMAQMEALIWPYPPLMGMPAELAPLADKVVRTGPFLLTGDVPDRAACRARLGRPGDQERVLYAPRGFPFGRDFGHRVLAAIYGAVAALRATTHPNLELSSSPSQIPRSCGASLACLTCCRTGCTSMAWSRRSSPWSTPGLPTSSSPRARARCTRRPRYVRPWS